MSYYNWIFLVLISLTLTINNVLCWFDCINRHCCLPKHDLSGNTASFNINCNTLGLEDCILNNDICEWECTPSHTAETQRALLRAGYTKRSFKKISKGDGEYIDPKIDGTKPPNSPHGEPETVEEVIKYTQIMSVDECGIVYQYEMDTVSANVELNRIKNRKKRKQRNSKNKDKGKGNGAKSVEFNRNQDLDDRIRRLTVFGDDSRTQITDSLQMRFSGYLQFTTALGVEKRCSASLIGPNWIITAAHCVHSGKGPFGGSWYSNWRFYPGLTAADQMQTLQIDSLQAWTFGEWANSFAPNWNYDIGWIQLNTIDTGIPYLNIAYDDTITHGTDFSIVGYPGDQQWLTKWHQLCSWTFVTADIMFTNKCDISGGSSGSPVYKLLSDTIQNEKEIYCIVSWENAAYNGCARITQSKYDSICSFIGCNDDGDGPTISPTKQPVTVQPAV